MAKKKVATKKRSWFVQKLRKLGACSDAIRYAESHRSFPAAWQECKDADWLRWLIRTVGLIPAHKGSMRACPGCKWDREQYIKTPSAIKKRFPAERVAKALRAK